MSKVILIVAFLAITSFQVDGWLFPRNPIPNPLKLFFGPPPLPPAPPKTAENIRVIEGLKERIRALLPWFNSTAVVKAVEDEVNPKFPDIDPVGLQEAISKGMREAGNPFVELLVRPLIVAYVTEEAAKASAYRAADSAAQAANNAVNEAARKAAEAATEAASEAEQAAEEATVAVKDAIQDVEDGVQEATNQFVIAAENSAEEANENADDCVNAAEDAVEDANDAAAKAAEAAKDAVDPFELMFP